METRIFKPNRHGLSACPARLLAAAGFGLPVFIAISAWEPVLGQAASTQGAGAPLMEPAVIQSEAGLLETTLTAAPARVTVGGRTFRSNVFNGQYLGPTLLIRRNDEVRLTLENDIGAADFEITEAEPTNLHFHGMAIPPVKPADYIYMTVAPRGVPVDRLTDHDGHVIEPSPDLYEASFEYVWQVPANHAKGAYWYHPHMHGFVEGQVLSGMSGMILIDGLVSDHYPELRDLRERVLVLKEMNIANAVEGTAPAKLVNGQIEPVISLRPGEWQVWQVGNLGANAFFEQSLAVAARLREPAVNTGDTGMSEEDVRAMGITRRRVIEFSESPDGQTFYIDGKTFDPTRDDIEVQLGDVEEWTIRNVSDELHTFHIHQLDFLVTHYQGEVT